MPTYQVAWMFLAVVCSGLGFTGIVWCRCGRKPAQACWGRRLFLLVLFALGGGSLIAAGQPHTGLPYLGLAFAGLVIAMVWEVPQPQPTQRWLAEEA